MRVPTIVGVDSRLEHIQRELEELYDLYPSSCNLIIAIIPSHVVEGFRSLNGYLELTRIDEELYFLHNRSLSMQKMPFYISGPSRGSGAVYWCNDPETGLLVQDLAKGAVTSSHYHEKTKETFLGGMGKCYLYRCRIQESTEEIVIPELIEKIVLPRTPILTETRIAHQLEAISRSINFILCNPQVKDMSDHFSIPSLIR